MIEFNATFLVSMLSFVVFMFIMNAIFYEPVLKIMRSRQDYIDSNYKKADEYSKNTCDLENQKAELLSKTKQECRESLAESTDAAQAEALKIFIDAKSEINDEIEQKKVELFNQQKDVESKISSGVISELSEVITNKIMSGKV